MTDIIDIAVVVRDFATSKMDRITDAIERDVARLEKKTGKISKGFDDAAESVRGFDGDANALSVRLQRLQNDFEREASQIDKHVKATLRGKTSNRDFENSFRRLALSSNQAAKELERGGMVNAAEDLRDVADQLEHQIDSVDSSVGDLNTTFRRNREIAHDTSGELRNFAGMLGKSRGELRSLAKDSDGAGDKVAFLESRFQRLTRAVERWAQASIQADKGLAGFGKQFLGRMQNLNTTIDRSERRFIFFLSLIPSMAVALERLAGAVTSLVAGLFSMVSALGALAGALVVIPGLVAAVGGAFASILTVIGPAVTGIIKGVQLLQRAPSKEAARAARRGETGPTGSTDPGVMAAEADLRRQRLLGIDDVQQAEKRLKQVREDNARQEADQVRAMARLKRDSAEQIVRLQRELNDLLRRDKETREQLVENLALARANVANAQPGELAQAQGGAKDAAAELRDFDRDSKATEADAKARLKDAQRNQIEQIADLNRQIQRTRELNQRQVIEAEQAIVQAARKGKTSILETNAAWLALSPTQRRIAREIQDIRKQFRLLTGGARETVFDFIDRAIGKVREHLPGLAGEISGFTRRLTGVGDKFLGLFDDRLFARRFKRIADQGQQTVTRLGDGLLHLVRALVSFTDAGRPVIDFFTKGFDAMGKWAERAVETGRRTGTLNTFFEHTIEVARTVGHILRDLFVTLKNIGEIASPFGRELLRNFEDFAAHLRDVTGAGGSARPKIFEFFKDATPVFREFAILLKDIVATFFRIGAAANQGGENSGMFKFLKTIDEGLPRFERFVTKTSREFGPVLGKFFGELINVIGALTAGDGPLAHFIGFLTLLLKGFNSLPGPIKSFAAEFLFFGRLFGITGALSKVWGDLLKATFTSVFRRVGPAAMRIFADEMSRLSIGTRLYAASMAKSWKGFVDKFRNDSGQINFGSITSKTKEFVKKFGDALASGAGKLKTFATALLNFSRVQLAAAVASMKRAFVAMTAAIVEFFVGLDIAISATGIGAILVAIGFLIAGIIILQEKFHAFTRAGQALASAARRFMSGLVEAFTHPIRWLKAHWKDLLMAALLGPIYVVLRLLAPRLAKGLTDAFKDAFVQLGRWLLGIGRWFYDHLIHPILSFFRIASPSKLMYDIGVKIVRGLLDGLLSLGGLIAREMLDLGKKIVKGIVDGIKSAGSWIKDAAGWVKDKLLGGLKSGFGIFSPSRLMYVEVGQPIGQGVVDGATAALLSLDQKMVDAVRRAIDKTAAAIRQSRSKIEDAFSTFGDFAGRAFDAGRSRELTPSERRLKQIQDSRDRAQRQQALRDAETQASDARREAQAARAKIARARKLLAQKAKPAAVSVDGTEIGEGQSVQDAASQTAATAAAQNEQRAKAKALLAEGQRELKEANRKEKEAIRAKEDAKTEILVAALEKRAEVERRKKDERDRIERSNFEKQLAKLQTMALTGKLSAKETQERIIALFHKYRVPYEDSGTLLGTAFAKGFSASMDDLLARIRLLHKQLVRALQLKDAEKKALSQQFVDLMTPAFLRGPDKGSKKPRRPKTAAARRAAIKKNPFGDWDDDNIPNYLDASPWGDFATGGIYKAVRGGILRFAEAGHDEAFISLDPKLKERSYRIIAEVIDRLGPSGGGAAIGRAVSKIPTIGAALSAWQGARTAMFTRPSMTGMPSFATGGIAVSGPATHPAPTTTSTRTVNQNFENIIQSPQDWDYVMRVAAQHAEAVM